MTVLKALIILAVIAVFVGFIIWSMRQIFKSDENHSSAIHRQKRAA